MARKTFNLAHLKFEEKVRRFSLALHRESAQRLAHESNVPIANGGKMPVDTGFLQNSQGTALNGVLTGPSKGSPNMTYSVSLHEPIDLVLLSANLGDMVFLGWTANYAPYMEARYGFQRSAWQRWQYIVDEAAVSILKRIRT